MRSIAVQLELQSRVNSEIILSKLNMYIKDFSLLKSEHVFLFLLKSPNKMAWHTWHTRQRIGHVMKETI